MSERPTPEQLAEELLDGAILRLAEEARVLALAASAEMERLREQVIEARADADRRVAEERATVVEWLREHEETWHADVISAGEHLRDRGAS